MPQYRQDIKGPNDVYTAVSRNLTLLTPNYRTACLEKGFTFLQQKSHAGGTLHNLKRQEVKQVVKYAPGKTPTTKTTHRSLLRGIREVSETAGGLSETKPPLSPFPTPKRSRALRKARADARLPAGRRRPLWRPGSAARSPAERPGRRRAAGSRSPLTKRRTEEPL